MDIKLQEITGEDIKKIIGLTITGWSKGDDYNCFSLEGPGINEARLEITTNGKMFYGQKEFNKERAFILALSTLNEICDIDHKYWIMAGKLWCGNTDINVPGEVEVCFVDDIKCFQVCEEGYINIYCRYKTWTLTPKGIE